MWSPRSVHRCVVSRFFHPRDLSPARLNTSPDNAVTEEEIKTLVAEASTSGVIEEDERAMIAGVLRLGGRAVRAVMTPRAKQNGWM